MTEHTSSSEMYKQMHDVVQRAKTVEDIALLDRQLDVFADEALRRSIELMGDPTESSQDSSEDE